MALLNLKFASTFFFNLADTSFTPKRELVFKYSQIFIPKNKTKNKQWATQNDSVTVYGRIFLHLFVSTSHFQSSDSQPLLPLLKRLRYLQCYKVCDFLISHKKSPLFFLQYFIKDEFHNFLLKFGKGDELDMQVSVPTTTPCRISEGQPNFTRRKPYYLNIPSLLYLFFFKQYDSSRFLK